MFRGLLCVAGGAGGLLPIPSEAIRLGGGLPGGVVDWTVGRGLVRGASTQRSGDILDDLRVGWGALSFSRQELTMAAGNVSPFSQISSSFLILSYIPAYV